MNDSTGFELGFVYAVLDSVDGAGHLVYGNERHRIPRNLRLGDPSQFGATFLPVPGYNGIVSPSCDGGGDFDGDGRPDLLLGDEVCVAPIVDRDPPGRFIVIFGADFQKEPYRLDRPPRGMALEDYRTNCSSWPGDVPRDPAFVGDVDGDGQADIAQATAGELILWYGPARKAFLAFNRGDANQDKAVDLADPIFILTYLFASGRKPPSGEDLDCRESACDG